MLIKDPAKSTQVELHKLNVYGMQTLSFTLTINYLLMAIVGPGSFFKAHVDTPQSPKMFNSLVIILPTKHISGSRFGHILGYSVGPCEYVIPLMAYHGILLNCSRLVCTLEPTVHTALYLRDHCSYLCKLEPVVHTALCL